MIGDAVTLARLLAHWRWSQAELAALRQRKLRRLIDHAYRNVPYYRARMEEAGLRPQDLQTEIDLERLPVTRKEDLRQAGEACLARGAGRLMTLHTSGHSGTPFQIRLTESEYRLRRLREFRMLLGMGLRPRDRLVLLGPLRSRPVRLHRLLGLYRLIVIPWTLSMGEQLARLEAARPDVLWFYPTTLKSLMAFAPGILRRIKRPRFLISSSSVLDSPTRADIERDLSGVPIREAYAANECGRIAADCRFGQGLHLEDDALIVELVDGGKPAEAGTPGSIVITCLDQFAMPFIRYELGDLVRQKGGACPCGRQSPLIDRPLGRDWEVFRSRDGSLIDPDVVAGLLRNYPGLVQFRFVQRSYELIEGQLVFEAPPPAERLEELRRLLEARVGHGVRFELRLPDRIDDERLKFRAFVCRLEEEQEQTRPPSVPHEPAL